VIPIPASHPLAQYAVDMSTTGTSAGGLVGTDAGVNRNDAYFSQYGLRNSFLSTLPTLDRGSASRNSTLRGTL
jgi:hypothetical protein